MTTCCFCLDDLGKAFSTSRCNHAFHTTCFDGWDKNRACLSKNTTCPFCRTVLVRREAEAPPAPPEPIPGSAAWAARQRLLLRTAALAAAECESDSSSLQVYRRRLQPYFVPLEDGGDGEVQWYEESDVELDASDENAVEHDYPDEEDVVW